MRSVPKWVWTAGQVAIAATLLALLWQAADGPEAARSLASAEWTWLATAVALLTVQTVLSALRWQVTARQLGISFGPAHAIREYYLAQVVNQSLPGGMVGDAARAYRGREQAGFLASGQAVVIERLVGQIAMFLTLAIAFAATYAVPGGLDWPQWLSIPVMISVLAGLTVPLVLWTAVNVKGAVGRLASRIWSPLDRALANRRVLPVQVGLSIGTTFCNLAAFAACAKGVGVELPLPAVAALVPLILFTMLIPISVSGWGLREGAAAALFPLAGASASGGLASSVAFGLSFIVAVLPGLVFLQLKPRAEKVNMQHPYKSR